MKKYLLLATLLTSPVQAEYVTCSMFEGCVDKRQVAVNLDQVVAFELNDSSVKFTEPNITFTYKDAEFAFLAYLGIIGRVNKGDCNE